MRRATPATAADFHDLLAAQIRISQQAAIELQTVFFGLGAARELLAQRRVAIVHEREVGGDRPGGVVELPRLLVA